MADESETVNGPTPSDVERTQVLARLILERIATLESMRRDPRGTWHGGFTPEHARELVVLKYLRDSWLLEGRR